MKKTMSYILLKKNQAREELKVDTLDAVAFKKIVLTMDLQAVKLCPALNASALYYSMKLKVHNFTVYNLEPNTLVLIIGGMKVKGNSMHRYLHQLY